MNIFNKKLKGITVAILLLGACAVTENAMAQKKDKKQKEPQQTDAAVQTPQPEIGQQAPTTFSDQDLQQFADASARLIAVHQEGEQTMMNILQEEKLSVEKFNEMAKAHQEQKLTEVQATPEEMAAFDKAAKRMVEMQPAFQKDLEEAIQQDGMTLEKFEQIMLAYRQDQSVQQRVDLLMQEKQN
ncbi:DUF4168 domain-containing protein [Pontibacter chinhatensis]|uniref:DUF4168 domain-containing protein n=1 Tax=Pontibacter chinhatensis TaxID=1436961 RepID=A0A1I2TE86_9BACT|nr:DUF4168 domain-containing protein [Pontibacter chinhatensis]SFG63138.1 protein of unknown function [Pontibacter chinhatensis]